MQLRAPDFGWGETHSCGREILLRRLAPALAVHIAVSACPILSESLTDAFLWGQCLWEFLRGERFAARTSPAYAVPARPVFLSESFSKSLIVLPSVPAVLLP